MNKKALPKYVLYTKFSQQEVKDIIEELSVPVGSIGNVWDGRYSFSTENNFFSLDTYIILNYSQNCI